MGNEDEKTDWIADISQLEPEIWAFIREFRQKNPLRNPGKKAKWALLNYLLWEIRNKFFKSGRKTHDGRGLSRIRTDDPEQFFQAWGLYKRICYKFETIPTLERFCTMACIPKQTLYRWAENRTNVRCDYKKRILEETEADLLASAIEDSNIGAIFVLRARYHWGCRGSGQNTILQRYGDIGTPQMTQEEIQQRLQVEQEGQKNERIGTV